ncbi:MAG: hypothetical protein K0S20_121 [Patescibacteria group bacterium]|jgi:hypothetical protein|nr:hypothetical protein [Patescibacteria group bacterium]
MSPFNNPLSGPGLFPQAPKPKVENGEVEDIKKDTVLQDPELPVDLSDVDYTTSTKELEQLAEARKTIEEN